jgi:hypothetical protein
MEASFVPFELHRKPVRITLELQKGDFKLL